MTMWAKHVHLTAKELDLFILNANAKALCFVCSPFFQCNFSWMLRSAFNFFRPGLCIHGISKLERQLNSKITFCCCPSTNNQKYWLFKPPGPKKWCRAKLNHMFLCTKSIGLHLDSTLRSPGVQLSALRLLSVSLP